MTSAERIRAAAYAHVATVRLSAQSARLKIEAVLVDAGAVAVVEGGHVDLTDGGKLDLAWIDAFLAELAGAAQGRA
jgi:hypothetical protein